jgi:hypothetical protein
MPHAALTPEQIALAGRIEDQLSKLTEGRQPSRRAVERALAVVIPSIDQLIAITDEPVFDELFDRYPAMGSFMEFMGAAALGDDLFDIYEDNDRSFREAP